MAAECKPVYLLAGGGLRNPRRDPDPLAKEALDQAGIKDPSVAYVGAASGDNAGFCGMISRLLMKAGAKEVRLAPLCGSSADPQKARRVIESCHTVFLSGGDVEAGMDILAETGMIDFLRDQYRQGKFFFGLSAGSIMLARSWIRWRDPEDESSAELFPCLGIAPVYCDTHDEEDGWEELQALTGLVPVGTSTYGIASGTALIANPDGSVRALGGEVHRFARTRDDIVRLPSI
jgi:cyanophycinase-like exopeptidase